MNRPPRTFSGRLLRLLQLPLALIVMFYEWGWATLAHLFDWFARRPWWAAIEAGIRRLPPWPALLLFGAPGVALVPVKLFALWLMASGQQWLGVAVIVAAKVLGTAIVARLFALTQPALMQLAWFARGYRWFVPWKDAWLEAIRASLVWRMARVIKFRLRRALTRLVRLLRETLGRAR